MRIVQIVLQMIVFQLAFAFSAANTDSHGSVIPHHAVGAVHYA